MADDIKRPFPLLWVLFLFALAVRVLYLSGLQNNPLFDTFPQALDHFNFDQGATRFMQGDWLAGSTNNSFSPLYKYFLGVLYLVSGRNFYFIYMVQFCMGAFASVLVYLITRDLFGKRAGLVAFLGFALYSTEIIYEGILLRAAFITFLGLLSFYLVSRLAESLNTRTLVLATLSLSLFFQSRPNTFLCLPLVCLFLHRHVFLHAGPEERRRYWGMFVGVLMLSFIPLLVQCYIVHGKFVFFDASGPHSFITGNLTNYSGVGFDPRAVDEFVRQSELNYSAVFLFLWKQVTGDFLGVILLYLRKLYFFFNDIDAPSNISVYVYREFSFFVSHLWTHFALFSSLGLVGMTLAFKERKSVFLLFSYMLSLTLAILIFHNTARYRLPVMPYFIIFSGFAVDRILSRISRKKFQEAGAIVVVTIVIFISFLTPGGINAIRQIDYCNMGKAYFQNPRLFDLQRAEATAIKCWEIERKIDLDHTYGKSLLASIYNLYAVSFFKKDNLAEAEKMLNHSRKVFPFHAYPYKLQSIIHQKRGQRNMAIRMLLAGSLADPLEKDNYEILLNFFHEDEKNYLKEIPVLIRLSALEKDAAKLAGLQKELQVHYAKSREIITGSDLSATRARTFYLNQQWDLAAPEYERLNAVNGFDDMLFLEQGVVLGNLQRYEEALDALYSALLINPDNQEAYKILGDYYYHIAHKPFMALTHLKGYINRLGDTEDTKRRELFDHLHVKYGTQERSVLVSSLSAEENRNILIMHQSFE